MSEPLSPMPTSSHANDLVARVAYDHDITQDRLAAETGLSQNFISRVFSGQYCVPVQVVAALIRLTRDARLVRLVLGEHEHIVIVVPIEPGLTMTEAVASATRNAGQFVLWLGRFGSSVGWAREFPAAAWAMMESIAQVLRLQSRAASPPAPTPKPARPFDHAA